jgi:regulator of PEP synthase PpsR (kinase-PPPase family)
MQRHVFFISDGTGITAEHLGLSLVSQFEGIHFIFVTLPFVDSPEKAEDTARQIQASFEEDGEAPLLFVTLINPVTRAILDKTPGIQLNLFDHFIPQLEKVLGKSASGKMGRTHSVHNKEQYYARIEAINYTLSTDDGLNPKNYDLADVILVGVSRSGKTPTSIYLALHYGIAAANYPITADDLTHDELPHSLNGYASKCFGLTIDPSRLTQIREQRFNDSQYASLRQCTKEVLATEAIFKQAHIPYLNTTQLSVEEIATKIVAELHLDRKIL